MTNRNAASGFYGVIVTVWRGFIRNLRIDADVAEWQTQRT
jgi:hypothetical protein